MDETCDLHFPLHQLMLDGRQKTTRGRGQIYEEVLALLAAGMDPNTRNAQGQSALGVLAAAPEKQGHTLELARLLVRHGAKLIELDRPLVDFEHDTLRCLMEDLVQQPDIRAPDGSNPLHVLAESAPQRFGLWLNEAENLLKHPTIALWLSEQRDDGNTPLAAIWADGSRLRTRQDDGMDYEEDFEMAWTALREAEPLIPKWNTTNKEGLNVATLFYEGVAKGGDVPDYLEPTWLMVKSEYRRALLEKETEATPALRGVRRI